MTHQSDNTTQSQPARREHWLTLLASLVLALLVSGLFWPILGFEFVDFDTEEQLINNRSVHGLTLQNLKTILTSRCITSYYPVRSLTYAIDYEFWGLRPAGFKLTNGLIHLANVLLLFSLVLRFLRHPVSLGEMPRTWSDVAIAAFSAALLAVHPLVVEPVAWVPGREELLMTLGALGCLHFHLSARRLDAASRSMPRRLYSLSAAVCCLAACMSNAAAAVIPLLVTVWDLLTLPKPRFSKIVRGTALLWAIGAVTVVIKGRDTPEVAMETLPDVFSSQWLMLVVTVYLLNLKTLIWPAHLGILYEWVPSTGFRTNELILGSIAIGATLVLLWAARRRPVLMFGILWFCISLAPHSQLVPHHIARADRFLYLPLAGLTLSCAVALRSIAVVVKRAAPAAVLSTGCLVVFATLFIRSAEQIQTWQNSYTMWENCLAVSPVNPMAHRCFADILTKRGRFDQAIPHYRMALLVEPDNVDTLTSFAQKLATAEDARLRDCDLAIELAQRGCRVTGWKDTKIRRALAMACSGKAADLMARGRPGEAEKSFRQAIEAAPDYDVALLNLAMLLATCTDAKLRNPEEAVQLAERGCKLVGVPDQRRLGILAAAYAAAGRFDMAVSTVDAAIALAGTAGDSGMTEHLQNQRAEYRNAAASDNP